METLDEYAAAPRDPPRSLSGIDDRFYEALLRDFSAWPEEALEDRELRDECRRLLEREARLLDEARFEQWLELYARDCLYWIPAAARPGDPRREVAIAFDDRRRLEDRVFRLRSGYAWSQLPPSRTVHHVSNVELFAGLRVRCNLLVSEFRAGETRLWAGWCGYRLGRRGAQLEIEVKQVNLIDRDQNLRNPSIVL